MKGWGSTQPDGLPEGAESCPACGALPCDQIQSPDDLRREATDAVVDAIFRIMPNADGYEAKGFVASLYEDLHSTGFLGASGCPRCDDTGTKDYASFAMEPCDNPGCQFGRANISRDSGDQVSA